MVPVATNDKPSMSMRNSRILIIAIATGATTINARSFPMGWADQKPLRPPEIVVWFAGAPRE